MHEEPVQRGAHQAHATARPFDGICLGRLPRRHKGHGVVVSGDDLDAIARLDAGAGAEIAEREGQSFAPIAVGRVPQQADPREGATRCGPHVVESQYTPPINARTHTQAKANPAPPTKLG